MPDLKIYLLGAPLIEVDGVSAEVDTRKAIAMLAYLAVTGESHTRDALATMLWPELDQSRARAALRRTLSSLKSAVGDRVLEVEREVLGLNLSADVWLDCDMFLAYLAETQSHGHSQEKVCPRCIPPLNAAVDLYRDDFLSGFTLRDSSNFDDWQFFQSEEFRRKIAFALEKLVHGYAAQENLEKAIEYAHRWLALDQLQEAAHRQLMKLYALSGRRNVALRQYRECVRILDHELGVSPLEETVQLYETIRDNRFPIEKLAPEKKVVVDSKSPQLVEHSRVKELYTLVGRSAELDKLIQFHDSVDASGHFIVINGEGGIGKTRLAEEFLAHAWSLGAVTVKARCYEGEGDLSYGPFVEGLYAALSQTTKLEWVEGLSSHWLAETARLLPELLDLYPDLPDIKPLEGTGAQARFFEAIAQILLALSEGPVPGVLFIDDLHWADTASLDLLDYLVRRARRHPLLILGTWRAEEVTTGHRLDRILAEAQRAGTGTLITLSRLSSTDVEQLLISLSDPVLPASLSERLFKETEGLPFFVVEYISAILKEGSAPSSDHWSLPGGARNLLFSRLRNVTETGWQILTTAAVVGRSFDFETLRSVSGRSEEETIAALEDLIDQGIIQEVGDLGEEQEISFDFSHEKLRAFVFEQTSLARQRLLHRRIAEQWVNRARFTRDPGWLAGQVAHHYRQSGEDALAAEYYRLAGEQARQLYAHQDALAHYQTALAMGHPQVAQIHQIIGDLQTIMGDYPTALSSYETAAASADAAMLVEIEHKLGIVHHRLGEWGSAESYFQSALVALDEQNNLHHQSRIYADWSLNAHSNGQQVKSQELGRKALELAQAIEDLGALAQAYNLLGILARGRGDLHQAQDHLQKSLELAESMGDPWMRVAALNNLSLVLSQDNKISTAIPLLRSALDLCTSLGDRHREAALHNNLADLYHASERPEESMSHLKQSVSIFAEIGDQAGSLQPEVWKLVEW